MSVAADGSSANGPSSEPSVDSAANHAAYTSLATNIVNYVSVSPGVRQVYWQPVCTTGTTSTGSTSTTTLTACATASSTTTGTSVGGGVLVSLGADGTPGNGASYNPVISPDGQFVAFVSLATNLVSGVAVDGTTPQVYLRTMCDGATPLSQSSTSTTTACAPTTYLVSSPDGTTPGNGASSHPAIGNVGTFVAFVSTASNLAWAQQPFNPTPQVFEQDECQLATIGCVPIMSLISTPDGTALADGANSQPTISYDGRFVAFASTGTNLVGGPIRRSSKSTCGIPAGARPRRARHRPSWFRP